MGIRVRAEDIIGHARIKCVVKYESRMVQNDKLIPHASYGRNRDGHRRRGQYVKGQHTKTLELHVHRQSQAGGQVNDHYLRPLRDAIQVRKLSFGLAHAHEGICKDRTRRQCPIQIVPLSLSGDRSRSCMP